jgi:hypothetical protein
MSWALRIASAEVAPEAVAQCIAPLKVTQTSYLFCVCWRDDYSSTPNNTIAPTMLITRT